MNRRHFMLSTGALALASGQVQAASKRPVQMKKKLIIATVALGLFDDFLLPQKKTDLNSSKLLKVLSKHHNHMTFFQGISQPEIGSGHSRYDGLLSCNRRQTNGPLISLDQFIADRVIQEARYKSFNMADQGIVWNKYSRNAPTYFEKEPESLYRQLFTNTGDNEQLQADLMTIKSLRRKVASRGGVVEVYARSLSAMESEYRTDLRWSQKEIKKVDFNTELHLSDAHQRGYTRPFEQYLNLSRLAAQNDRAQVVTMSAPYVDRTKMIEANLSYHSAGHQCRQNTSAMEDLHKIENYLIEDFAKFMDGMVASGGLDDCMVLFMGGFNDAGSHRRETIPCILAGGGFKHQGIVDCQNKYRLSELYVSVLHQAGIDVNEFAGFSGNLDDILL